MKRLIFNAKKRSYWNTTIRHIHFLYFSKGAVIASTFYLFHLFHSIAVTQLLSLCTLYTRIRSFLIQRISTCAQRLPVDWGFDVKGPSSGCVVTTSCLRFCDSVNIVKFKLNNHPPPTHTHPPPPPQGLQRRGSHCSLQTGLSPVVLSEQWQTTERDRCLVNHIQLLNDGCDCSTH